MSTFCKICFHESRAEIENAILNLTADAPPNSQSSIDQIAEDYCVDVAELKAHALFHAPMGTDAPPINPAAEGGPEAESEFKHQPDSPISQPYARDSLTRKMKLREADMLSVVSNEYLVTLKSMGRKINKLAQTSAIDIEEQDSQVRLARLLSKPMVDLYIGLGGEIRQNVKTMVDIDRILNGPEDTNQSGLEALAAAIAVSKK